MAPDSQSTASLFDFLYVDRTRLAAFAAQLTNQGVLQTTKTTESTGGKSGGEIGIGAPKVLGLNLTGSSETSSAIEQHYDASWSLPLNVLDGLDESHYIRPDIASANIGELFLMKGSIRFLDYRVLKDCWEFIASMTTAENRKKGIHTSQAEKDAQKNLFGMMQKVPHSVELLLHGSAGEMVWTCPNPANLTIPSETLTFLHGSSIPGEWFLVGSLDGKPAAKGESFTDELLADRLAKPMVKELQIALSQIADGLRAMLGRPYYAYGATPLVIFRKIEASPSGLEPESDERGEERKEA